MQQDNRNEEQQKILDRIVEWWKIPLRKNRTTMLRMRVSEEDLVAHSPVSPEILEWLRNAQENKLPEDR